MAGPPRIRRSHSSRCPWSRSWRIRTSAGSSGRAGYRCCRASTSRRNCSRISALHRVFTPLASARPASASGERPLAWARRSKHRTASTPTFRILRTAMALRPGQPSAGTRTAAGSNSSRATATPAGPSRLQARRAFTKRLSAVTSCAPTRTAREKYVKS